MSSTLDRAFIKLVDFLHEEKISYLIIGGLAVGVLGEPRMTIDIDAEDLRIWNNLQKILK